VRSGAVLAVLAAGAVALPTGWWNNPGERTAKGIRAFERGDSAAASLAFDQALELAGEDPRLAFNSGTGHLVAGAPGAALPLLERAAQAEGEQRPDALYNLGNAKLATGDPAAAIAAYESALRLAPDHAAAKHNLELALKELQEQQPPPEQQPSDEGTGEGGDPQEGNDGERDPAAGQPQRPPEDGDPQQQGEPGDTGPDSPAPGEQQRGGRSPRLPQFDPQQDMSAEQAAALLEAVENLEREQRRAQAEAERAIRARTAVEKDW
jgi:tetratricopeptide (TPR) repeat protein